MCKGHESLNNLQHIHTVIVVAAMRITNRLHEVESVRSIISGLIIQHDILFLDIVQRPNNQGALAVQKETKENDDMDEALKQIPDSLLRGKILNQGAI